MEPAKIDWKRIESIFVEDELYEHINAPKWVDFLATEESADDEAWFCRPSCKHPKTAEDFLKSTPSKLTSSANGSESLPLRDQNRRDAKLKRRVATQCSNSKFNEDSENQNPNLSTPQNHQHKPMKAVTKSSMEKKKMTEEMSQNNEAPRLKSTLSARNLFAGRDILNQITEFCSELKRMASRVRERENVEKSEVGMEENVVKESSCQVLGEVNGKEKERKPLLEMGKEKSLGMGESSAKEKERKPLLEMGKEKSQGMGESSVKEKLRRKKKADEAENVPISLDLDNVRHKREGSLLQIRTNPPSPQCFSATRGPSKTTPSKASKSRLMERGILQEVEQNKEMKKEDSADKGRSVSIVDGGREARTLDVFWFLKPCTLSN